VAVDFRCLYRYLVGGARSRHPGRALPGDGHHRDHLPVDLAADIGQRLCLREVAITTFICRWAPAWNRQRLSPSLPFSFHVGDIARCAVALTGGLWSNRPKAGRPRAGRPKPGRPKAGRPWKGGMSLRRDWITLGAVLLHQLCELRFSEASGDESHPSRAGCIGSWLGHSTRGALLVVV